MRDALGMGTLGGDSGSGPLIHFDEQYRIRVFDPKKYEHAEELKEETSRFREKLAEFEQEVGTLLKVMEKYAARIEKAKSLAVGRRVLRDLDQLKVERRRAHKEANLKLKKEELERLKETKDSLVKVKLEQEALISKLTMMGEGRDPGALL